MSSFLSFLRTVDSSPSSSGQVAGCYYGLAWYQLDERGRLVFCSTQAAVKRIAKDKPTRRRRLPRPKAPSQPVSRGHPANSLLGKRIVEDDSVPPHGGKRVCFGPLDDNSGLVAALQQKYDPDGMLTRERLQLMMERKQQQVELAEMRLLESFMKPTERKPSHALDTLTEGVTIKKESSSPISTSCDGSIDHVLPSSDALFEERPMEPFLCGDAPPLLSLSDRMDDAWSIIINDASLNMGELLDVDPFRLRGGCVDDIFSWA